MKEAQTFILISVAIVIMGIFFGTIFMKSMDRSEIAECKLWEKQSEEFKNFYLTEWQNQQCSSHGIIINAVIK